MVGRSEGGGEGVAGAFIGHGAEEGVDGFLEASFQEELVACEGDASDLRIGELGREVVAVDGVEEEEGADAWVEVVLLAAELVEEGAFAQQVVEAEFLASQFERGVAPGGIFCLDDGNELGIHGWSYFFAARSSMREVRISSRCGPARPRAIWARRSP